MSKDYDVRYLLIFCSEDGDKFLSYTSEKEIQEIYKEADENEYSIIFAKDIPDLNRFVGYILIKGEIVIPEAKEIKTKYILP